MAGIEKLSFVIDLGSFPTGSNNGEENCVGRQLKILHKFHDSIFG